jgi:hypothetical protein
MSQNLFAKLGAHETAVWVSQRMRVVRDVDTMPLPTIGSDGRSDTAVFYRETPDAEAQVIAMVNRLKLRGIELQDAFPTKKPGVFGCAVVVKA